MANARETGVVVPQASGCLGVHLCPGVCVSDRQRHAMTFSRVREDLELAREFDAKIATDRANVKGGQGRKQRCFSTRQRKRCRLAEAVRSAPVSGISSAPPWSGSSS